MYPEKGTSSRNTFYKHHRTVLKTILAQITLGSLTVDAAIAAPKNYAGNERTELPKRNTLEALGIMDIIERFENIAFKLPA